jgi:serine/threonine protein kinase
MKGSEKAVKYVKGLPLKLKKKWENKYPKVNPSAIGFLILIHSSFRSFRQVKIFPLNSRLLTFDPDKRITAEEALKHEYLSKIYDEEDLIDLDIFEYQFDDSIDLDVDQDAIKRMIYQEIVDFNKTQNHIFGDGKLDDDEEEIVIIEEKK